MKWSVGEVIHSPGNRVGHSFSVANEHRAPIFTITYRTAAEAELARSVVTALLTEATEVSGHAGRHE
jgi:hypothetical protein